MRPQQTKLDPQPTYEPGDGGYIGYVGGGYHAPLPAPQEDLDAFTQENVDVEARRKISDLEASSGIGGNSDASLLARISDLETSVQALLAFGSSALARINDLEDSLSNAFTDAAAVHVYGVEKINDIKTFTSSITSALGAITTSQPAFTSTVTFNAGGVAFTHWFANITNTASAAGSMFVDLQVGSVSKFNVLLTGAITSAAYTSGRIPYISTGGLFVDSSNFTWDSANGVLVFQNGSAGTATGALRTAGNMYIDFDQANTSKTLTFRAAGAGATVATATATGWSFNQHVTMANGKNFIGSGATGNSLGSATNQKWSVYGVTPVVQATAPTATGAAVGSSTNAAVATTASTLASYGYTQAQADSIPLAINAMKTVVDDCKTLVNALRTTVNDEITRLQNFGIHA